MSSGSSSNVSSEVNSLKDIATGQVQLSQQVETLGGAPYNDAGTVFSEGQNIYSPAYNQYTAGQQGILTPAQTALVNQNLATSNTGTQGTYGGLGLGGSTMEGQDLSNNQLKSEAENANISFGNETLGLEGLQTANQYSSTAGNLYNTADQYYNTAESALSGAGTSVYNAGNLTNTANSQLNSAISSLGNKSGSSLSSLFGSSAGGAGLGSLLGSSGGSAAAGSTVADAATGLIAFA